MAWLSSAPFGWPVVPEVYRITAVSSAARSATVSMGSAAASSCSKSPGVVMITWVPVTPAAFCASSANSGKTTATLAPQSWKVKEISPAFSSGFIGTTIAPRRRIA